MIFPKSLVFLVKPAIWGFLQTSRKHAGQRNMDCSLSRPSKPWRGHHQHKRGYLCAVTRSLREPCFKQFQPQPNMSRHALATCALTAVPVTHLTQADMSTHDWLTCALTHFQSHIWQSLQLWHSLCRPAPKVPFPCVAVSSFVTHIMRPTLQIADDIRQPYRIGPLTFADRYGHVSNVVQESGRRRMGPVKGGRWSETDKTCSYPTNLNLRKVLAKQAARHEGQTFPRSRRRALHQNHGYLPLARQGISATGESNLAVPSET